MPSTLRGQLGRLAHELEMVGPAVVHFVAELALGGEQRVQLRPYGRTGPDQVTCAAHTRPSTRVPQLGPIERSVEFSHLVRPRLCGCELRRRLSGGSENVVAQLNHVSMSRHTVPQFATLRIWPCLIGLYVVGNHLATSLLPRHRQLR
jgi:hypothetical protein